MRFRRLLEAKLHDLPPALFTIGTLDPWLDDTLFMYARWTAAELAVYPGDVHGFTGFPYALANRANQRMIDFLKKEMPTGKSRLPPQFHSRALLACGRRADPRRTLDDLFTSVELV